MNNSEQWHYTDQTRASHGPVSKAELMQLISSNSVTPDSMVWKEGMADWMVVSEVLELKVQAQTQPAPNSAPAPMATVSDPTDTEEVNPYAPPKTVEDEASTLGVFQPQQVIEYGGIGRLSYFLRTIGYFFALVVVMLVSISFNSTAVLIVICIIFIVMFIRLHCLRLKNIGMSGWWVVAMIIPIVSHFLTTVMYACPTGYRDTRKMDTSGIIIAVICITFFVLSFFSDNSTREIGRVIREIFRG